VHTVFGKPLKESLKYASVQISTANANGELYVWGYIPVVVAKWYVYCASAIFLVLRSLQRPIPKRVWYVAISTDIITMLTPHKLATEVEGTFRVNGSNKRMRDLQAEFEAAPRVRMGPASAVYVRCSLALIHTVRKVFGLEEGELHNT
jgi:hypothetical protein